MPYLGCLLYNVLVPSVIRHILDFSSILFAMLLMAWPCILPSSPLLSSTSSAVLFVALPHVLPFLLLSSFLLSSTVNTPYTYAPFHHIWNTQLLSFFFLSLVSLILLHTLSSYLLVLQIYFGALIFPFLSLDFCSCRLDTQTSYIFNTLFLAFSLVLPLTKWEHAFLWAGCSWYYGIVVETLWQYLRSIDRMLNFANLLLCLLGCKIFTQPDAYFPTDYYSNLAWDDLITLQVQVDKRNLMEFLLFSIHYLYNYYMVCALLSHTHVIYHVTSCDVILWLWL